MNNKLIEVTDGISGLFGMAVATVIPFLRSRRLKWGANEKEPGDILPGDQLIDKPRWQYTQAITITTSADRVWPWLIQIGQGRGGFYSYQLLENTIGCQIHNAERIIPEFQHLEAGDNILLHPKVPFPVNQVETGRAIVLHYDTRKGLTCIPGTKSADFFESSWLFFLKSKDDETTRLVSRFKIDYSPGIRNKVLYGYFTELISSTMQQQMLRGIKQRAESAHASSARAI